MFDRLILICLGLWALLFGFFAVTSIKVVWGPEIEGWAALILGIVCIIRVIMGWARPGPPA